MKNTSLAMRVLCRSGHVSVKVAREVKLEFSKL